MSASRLPPRPPHQHPVPSDGRRHVGPLEAILYREWAEGQIPPRQIITAIDRIASLPAHLTGRLLDGLTGIHVGIGMVPDLDDMAHLDGKSIFPGEPWRGTWNHTPGAYHDRKIIIGSGGEPLVVDLLLHEVGHALDDLDGVISNSPGFRALHTLCTPALADDRYHNRAEFFAEAFALVQLAAWSTLVTWLSGNTERAYAVRVWFGANYAIGR